MKAVMMSIRPRWCELIFDRSKRVEVRKTKPNIPTPIKCYIYCTTGNRHEALVVSGGSASLIACDNWRTAIPVGGVIGNGKVIGEFICDNLVWVVSHPAVFAGHTLLHAKAIADACLTEDEAEAYSGGKDVYGWHITELVIYDKPRELGAFRRVCKNDLYCESCAMYCNHKQECGNAALYLSRPPQSWCYVEELK